jgi:hypothetical protein
MVCEITPRYGLVFFLNKRGCPGWGSNLGPVDFMYFLIFTTLLLSHSGSPGSVFFDEVVSNILNAGNNSREDAASADYLK